MTPPSCFPDTADENPCKHIRQAATRRHLECVKHFWGLRMEGNPEEESLEKQAVHVALNNKDFAIAEYLLSRCCPSDPSFVAAFLLTFENRPWSELHDLYDIAFKYKLLSQHDTNALLLGFMEKGQWDFLEKIRNYGHTFERVHTRVLALAPDGANVAALRELHMREAFRTADLSWLTPQFALEVNDQSLLEFACELQPALVTAAKEKAEDPAMREWLNNHLKKI